MEMGSMEAEELCNTETEEETVALQKKRSRRVSFAEITSVHVFDRDEDCETTPPPSSLIPQPQQPHGPVLGFLKDLAAADTDGSKEKEEFFQNDDDDDEDEDGRNPFFRPAHSPSSASIIGSATSNDDEDNFFGPVSASFIRSRKVSDSANSDENHDITMDSEAFSMHFRSLARSELVEDARTPTGVHLAFEERTPTQNTTSASDGSSMALTEAKKQIPVSPIDKVSAGGDSNDMSLLVENPHKYDFGRLPPGLDAIFIEGSKDLHAISVSDEVNVSNQSNKKLGSIDKHGTAIMYSGDSGDIGPASNSNYDVSFETSPATPTKLGETNEGSIVTPIDRITHVLPSSVTDAPADVFLNRTPTPPRKGTSLGNSQHSMNFELKKSTLKVASAFNNGIESCKNDNFLRLDLKAQPESGILSSTEVLIKEDCPMVDSHISSVDTSMQNNLSALAASVSGLSAKRRKSYLDTGVSSSYPWKGNSSTEQLGSYIGKHGERGLVIQESKNLVASPSASTFEEGPSNTKLQSSDFLSKTRSPCMVLEEHSIHPESYHLASAPISRSQEHLLVFGQRNKDHETLTKIGGNRADTPKCADLSQTEDSLDLIKNGGYLDRTPVGKDSPIKVTATPTLSGIKVPLHLSKLENSTDGTLGIPRSDYSIVGMKLDDREGEKAPAYKFVSSPMKMKPSVSPGIHGSLRDLQQRDHNEKSESFASGNYEDLLEDVADATETSVIVGKMDSLPSLGIHDLQYESRASRNFRAPSRNRDDLSFQSGNPDRDLVTGIDPARSLNVHHEGGTKGPIFGSSPYIHKSLNERDLQSASGKESCKASDNHMMNCFVGKVSPSSTFSQLRSRHGKHELHQGIDILKTRVPIQDFGSSLKRKRSGEEMLLRDRTEKTVTQSTLENQKGGSHDWKFPLQYNSKLNLLDHIFARISRETKQLLSPLTDELNLQAIVKLEDIVARLQKIKMYESFCSENRLQKLYPCSDVRQIKIAEARSLLYEIAYERAKFQLASLKREKLQKGVHLVNSGIEKFQMFKLILSQRPSRPGIAGSQMDGSHPQTCTFNLDDKNKLHCDEVAALKQELEASDRKVKSLTKFFHDSCKMDEELNCEDSIVFVNDYLKRRMSCMRIHKDLRLWEVDDLVSRKGHQSVVLNYKDLLHQRLTVNAGHILVTNKLSETDISKKFPGMDASTAYAFVLAAESSHKYLGPRNLAKETQITSSLLSNLLDVVEEVHLAKTELRNLTRTSFYSPTVPNLHLELCFINFKNGRKAVLTLDMTSLNCGIYPSEILPLKIQVSVVGLEESMPQSLSTEISVALGSLRCGFARIIRLCRCVSYVVQQTSK